MTPPLHVTEPPLHVTALPPQSTVESTSEHFIDSGIFEHFIGSSTDLQLIGS